MNSTMATRPALSTGRRMLNKVPEVTIYFWLIKILCTTVGETAADYLSTNVGWGAIHTMVATGSLLAALLVTQFSLRRYVPGVYWSSVVVTLSIHTIRTTRREAFYWLALLFTFALGPAAGDLVAEKLSLGYGISVGVSPW